MELPDEELETIMPEDPSRAIELRDAFDELDRNGIQFSDRSAVRNQGGSLLPPDVYNGVLAYIDASYNRLIASSVNAGDRVFSDISGGDYAQVAAKLSAQRPPNKERFEGSDVPINVQIDLSLLAKFGKPIPWDKVWDILTDCEWEKSATNLQNNYVRGSNEEPLWKHLDLVTKMFDEEVGSLQPDAKSGVVRFVRNAPEPLRVAGEVLIEIVSYTLAPGLGLVRSLAPRVATRIRRGSLRRAILRSIYQG